MGEKRQSVYNILLRKPGKQNHKVEIFKANGFEKKWALTRYYRLRVDGKWFSPYKKKYCFFTKLEIMELIKKAIDI